MSCGGQGLGHASSSGELSRRPPLLLVDLAILPDNSGFCYSTSVDAIHSRTVAMFDRAIAKLQVGSVAA